MKFWPIDSNQDRVVKGSQFHEEFEVLEESDDLIRIRDKVVDKVYEVRKNGDGQASWRFPSGSRIGVVNKIFGGIF